jgi:hypothetical protein
MTHGAILCLSRIISYTLIDRVEVTEHLSIKSLFQGGEEMKPARKPARRKHTGAVLVLSMIFVAVFSALAASMVTLSDTNAQLASNHHNLNAALVAAQSGQEVLRYWLSRVLFDSSTPQDQYFSQIVTSVQDELAGESVTSVAVANDGSIAAALLDSATGAGFDGAIAIHASEPTVLRVCVTGHSGQASRTITTSFNIEPYEFPIFNFGLATKGPLNFPGNPTITAASEAWEADMFVESSGSPLAVKVLGNTNFDGDIDVGNASANVFFDGDVQIAGDNGQTALDNHVSIGMESPEFPVPDTDHFRQYATGITIDSTTDFTKSMTLTNAHIPANINPVFDGNIRVAGVLFIESPNVVVFNGNIQIDGLIVADGDAENPGTDSMTFNGNFASGSFPVDSQFDNMREEDGSSVLAPGYSVTLSGNFESLGGVMAVSGFHLSGNAGAVVEGTVINYDEDATLVEGNVTLNFDRVGRVKIPAGFDLYRELDYQPSSYSES